eukprot:5615044-Pleurochrysis_carterae.AAC.2
MEATCPNVRKDSPEARAAHLWAIVSERQRVARPGDDEERQETCAWMRGWGQQGGHCRGISMPWRCALRSPA